MEEEKDNTDYSDDDEKLKNLIREALAMRIETRTKQKKQQNLNETLGGVVGEFLSSFIVMGYDLSGNPVTLKLAPTIQHNEALKSLLIKVFAKEIRPGYGMDEEIF
jgi:hypothetical protein